MTQEEYEKMVHLTKQNQWVSGYYDLMKVEVPSDIPQNNIKDAKVSVIIPCYNYGKYVLECIESIKNQTYKAHEIIVVNDGSTDDTHDILSKRDDIIYINQQNFGVAWARNNGAKKATGDFLIFIDADDILDSSYIEKTLQLQRHTNADVVSTDLEFFGEQTGIHKYAQHSHDTMLRWQNVPSSCALVKHQAHNYVGGFNPVAHYEDWAYWLEMYKKGMVFYKVDEPLFKYRKHGYSRITMLDEKQKEGFEELRKHYGIKR
jgi:cellulose synthase/poly-beta-1,6-N-acetylglucosamine synthase-like glycosyltransferase